MCCCLCLCLCLSCRVRLGLCLCPCVGRARCAQDQRICRESVRVRVHMRVRRVLLAARCAQELFVLLVWDGVLPGVAELFRRPGKDSDVRVALKSLVDGHEVDWHAYNLHTCANVAKVCLYITAVARTSHHITPHILAHRSVFTVRRPVFTVHCVHACVH